jgi:hypothetical protein
MNSQIKFLLDNIYQEKYDKFKLYVAEYKK